MKKGDRFRCPFCKEDSFLTVESVMEGWTKKGEIFKCAFCGKKIADVQSETDQQKPDPAEEARLRLQNLLGETPEEKVQVSLSETDRRFCKDCSYLVKHPFHLMCSLHDREVEPMQDCPDYKAQDTVSDATSRS